MNIKDFPEEWQILFKYDKDGNIVDCVDLYEKFERNPLRYSQISELEKQSMLKKTLEDKSPEMFEAEYNVVELGYAILSQKEDRQAYNQVYKEVHRTKLAKYFLAEGDRQSEEGNLERAIKCYDQVIQSPKARPEIAAQAYHNKGEMLEASGAKDEAKKHYYASLQKDPNNLDALVNCAEMASTDRKYDDAKKHYEKALTLQYNNKFALQGMIDCLVQENFILSANISICDREHKNSAIIEKTKEIELDEKGMIVPDAHEYTPTNEELELTHKIEGYIKEYQLQPSDIHLINATAAASALVKQYPKNSEAYHYLAVINHKQFENEILSRGENERVLNEALRQINASLNLNKINSAGWHLKKTVIEHLVEINMRKISSYRERLAESPDLGEIVDEEYHGKIDISAKDALIREALEKYDSIKDFIGFIKRSALCGYLPAKDQQKIAKEHNESAEVYTVISVGTELISGAAAGIYGFWNFDPLTMYAGAALFASGVVRAISTESSKSKVVGSPLAFWSHIKNYVAELRKKHGKTTRELAQEEIKLLEEHAADEFEESMETEEKKD